MEQLASATDDLNIGLVISNAGTGNPGEFLKFDRQFLQATLRLSAMAHLDITHHFGAKLAERRQGGAAGFTDTAVLEKFGLDPNTMPLKPMSVEQCVSEALRGLRKNRSRIVPGRLNRILNDALVPASLVRKMEADLLGKGLANKSAPANARAEA